MDNVKLLALDKYPGYYAGSDGEVYSMRSGNCQKPRLRPRLLRARLDNFGYLRVMMCIDGKHIDVRNHTLICEAFHGPKPDGMMVCHGPRGQRDNHPENLSWGTPKKNQVDDRTRDGTLVRGERVGGSRLKEGDVLKVCELYASGTMVADIAARYSVNRATVEAIIHGKTWRWLTGRDCRTPGADVLPNRSMEKK